MKLALGTAQFGLEYGISNRTGKPLKKIAFEIIDHAIINGIDVLDTASLYGDSENIIGEYLWDKTKEFDIVTKIPQISGKLVDREVDYFIKNIISSSIINLNVSSLDYCLMHHPANMVSHNGRIVEILNGLKKAKIIKKIGVSVYSPSEVKDFLQLDLFDVIQVPLNVFDQRLIKSGLLKKVYEKGIEIHVRSVYLQGLLLMNPNDLPGYLERAKKPLQDFRLLARKYKLTNAQLALLFIRDLKEVSKIIVGCETKEQLMENIEIFKMPALESNILIEVNEIFREISEFIINPSLWRENV